MGLMILQDKPIVRHENLLNNPASWLEWCREKLPNDNFFIMDIDGCIRNNRGDIMLIELKGLGVPLPTYQKVTLTILDTALKQLSESKKPVELPIGRAVITQKINYFGFHVIELSENGNPALSINILFDGIKIDESELIKLLSFDKDSHLKLLPHERLPKAAIRKH